VYCLCVNVYCHRVTTQLQLINISYHIDNEYYQKYLGISECHLRFEHITVRIRVGREKVKLNSVSIAQDADKVALLYSRATPKLETRNLTHGIEVVGQNYVIKLPFASVLHCRLEVE